MNDGSFSLNPTPWPLNPADTSLDPQLLKAGSSLHSIALYWLAGDRALRIQEEKEGKRSKTRGARTQVRVVTGCQDRSCILTSSLLLYRAQPTLIEKLFTKSMCTAWSDEVRVLTAFPYIDMITAIRSSHNYFRRSYCIKASSSSVCLLSSTLGSSHAVDINFHHPHFHVVLVQHCTI